VPIVAWGAEYLVWQGFDQRIDWFSLQNDYMTLLPEEDGVIRSKSFQGYG